jgi:hypothetical protein
MVQTTAHGFFIFEDIMHVCMKQPILQRTNFWKLAKKQVSPKPLRQGPRLHCAANTLDDLETP